MYEKDGKWYPGPIYGMENYLIDEIASAFNVSYELVHCNQTWGTKDSQGNWNGIIGAVHRKVWMNCI